MAATESTMLALGTPCPSFSLTDTVSGKSVSSTDYPGKPLLVMFICNHCPYVVHVRGEIGRIAKEYAAKGVGIIAISSNSVATHPQDGPGPMKRLASDLEWEFPYLFDETQAVAKAFHAVCTPEFYLFDESSRLVYRGQLDDSRPSNSIPVSGSDLRAALDAVVLGKAPSPNQKPSIGCNIKWAPNR